MKFYLLSLISTLLVSFCLTSPIESPQDHEETAELERRHHHHHHRHHGNRVEVVDNNLEAEIAKLRRLDAIIGKVEEAAMSRVSIDVPENSSDLLELSSVTALDDPSLEKFSVVALPYKFRNYDINKDGFVTTLELSEATGTMLSDCEEPFTMADVNGDGLLTEEELHNAPWVFNMEPNVH